MYVTHQRDVNSAVKFLGNALIVAAIAGLGAFVGSTYLDHGLLGIGVLITVALGLVTIYARWPRRSLK